MYAFTIDVPAPIEVYAAVHAAILERTGGRASGMILHLGRATATGFQVIEVWETREDYDRFAATTVAPVMTELGGTPPVPLEPVPFDLRGVILAGEPVAA